MLISFSRKKRICKSGTHPLVIPISCRQLFRWNKTIFKVMLPVKEVHFTRKINCRTGNSKLKIPTPEQSIHDQLRS
jgi:hypothetical protein